MGGGPAGLAAAVQLKKSGVDNILVIEREKHLGGILRQCIHDGFGLTRFGESLSGPEYAQRFIDEADRYGVESVADSTVIDIAPDKTVIAASRHGLSIYEAQAVILTMGCRERTRGALSIPGSRPAGIYTAGVAQSYINIKNLMIGKRIIILGSGDIGMIMARRLTLEGGQVLGVFEIQPYPSGLPRNIQQCLNDYDIPLYLNRTVSDVHGKSRLEGVTVSQVDEKLQPIPGSEQFYACDTLILSVGLIPENELSRKAGVRLDLRTKGGIVDENFQTSTPGIFAAGNVLHVHDLVDFVSLEAERLAAGVVRYLHQELPACDIEIQPQGLTHTIPQLISGNRDVELFFRVTRPVSQAVVELWQGDKKLTAKRLPKAIPAEMMHITLPASELINKLPVKAVVVNA